MSELEYNLARTQETLLLDKRYHECESRYFSRAEKDFESRNQEIARKDKELVELRKANVELAKVNEALHVRLLDYNLMFYAFPTGTDLD